MTITFGRLRGWCAFAVAAALAGACSGGPDMPSPGSAADAFFAAWSERKAGAMVRYLRPVGDERWTPRRLDRSIRRALRGGRISGLEVRRAGRPRRPDAGSAEIPYEIVYESEAADEPLSLRGEASFAYEPTRRTWTLSWDESLLWPGIDRAAGFEVSYRWLRRAAILDRDGRRLAAGPAEARRYPFGSIGGSVVGHIGTAGSRDLRHLPDVYGRGDLFGASGLEKEFDRRLSGRPGVELSVVDARGKSLEVLSSTAPRAGRSVETTLDVDVQRAATAALGSTTGGAAVLDPSTGEVLAAVGSGPFDPNGHVGTRGVEPFNRALSGLYPPGSSLKVVTAAAALDAGTVTPRTRLSGPPEYKGVRNFESGEFGTIDFATALKFSVNTAFAQVAERLGARRLVRYARAFGFGRLPRTRLPLATSSFPRPTGLGDLMWSAIGQGRVLATPVHMASVAATVANGGTRMEPHIEAQGDPEGTRIVSKRTAALLTSMMESVVRGGTGTAARIEGVAVAGKTGTAEVDVGGVRRNHAWFIAFAPAGAPRVAVSVVAEYGGVGGKVAAPMARRLLRAVLPLT